jgi:hypothetical protein
MSCKSSRSHGVGLAGAIRRCRRSGSVGCEKVRNARECPARAHHRSVRVRTGRVYGCRALARGQKTIYADAGRVHGVRGTDTADREISTQIQSRGSLKEGLEEREQKDHNQLQLVPLGSRYV